MRMEFQVVPMFLLTANGKYVEMVGKGIRSYRTIIFNYFEYSVQKING